MPPTTGTPRMPTTGTPPTRPTIPTMPTTPTMPMGGGYGHADLVLLVTMTGGGFGGGYGGVQPIVSQ